MSNCITNPIPQSGDWFLLEDIILHGEFKAYVEGLIKNTPLAGRFRPRLYDYSDYIIVKLYALTRGWSTHQAAQYLNDVLKERFLEKYDLNPKVYRDGKRKRRFIPHQTEVDKFYNRIAEQEVKTIFGGLLDYFTQKILREQCQKRSWTCMVDNTKYPYYGEVDPQKHLGFHKLPGTKVAWFFQGVSMHSEDIHVFLEFNSLTRGVYRALKVPDAIQWQQWLRVDITGMLFDREFYRAALVSDLHKLHTPVLFPTKKYPWVRAQMHNYLKGTGSFIIGNLFAQTAKQYPYQQVAFVRLVIIGKDGQGPWEVRDKFLQGHLTYKEAMKQLHGFFTNYTPWKNHKAWVRYLVKTYKRRWNIETGFAMLNKIHETGRQRNFRSKLADLYLRATVYNCWQSWRLDQIRKNLHHRDMTLTEFKYHIKTDLEEIIFTSRENWLQIYKK